MATPARTLIMTDIFDTLSAIAVANGDKTTPKKVTRTIVSWASVGAGDTPFLGFLPGRDSNTQRPFGLMEFRLRVQIVGHVNASSDAARSAELNDLIDDVVANLQKDTTRGGNAITTTIQEISTDEGDPDAIDSRGGGGSFVMVVEIFYERTTGAS